MHWIEQFDLFLFDLDGLLVNTEKLHYQAYLDMCRNNGCTLQWSFSQYFQIAQRHSDALQKEIYKALPQLHEQEPNWSILYLQKKNIYLDLLKKHPVELMPGALELLERIKRYNKTMCVVTHSAGQLVERILEKTSALTIIPHWIVREDYKNAKPSPDGYLEAIHRYGANAKKIIGFEDSQRGLEALVQTKKVFPVLVNDLDKAFYQDAKSRGILHVHTLHELCTRNQLV